MKDKDLQISVFQLCTYKYYCLVVFLSRIFASSKYESEELTVFNSSLIEDCVINNNGSLNGKYLGGFILIQPQYQKGKLYNYLICMLIDFGLFVQGCFLVFIFLNLHYF